MTTQREHPAVAMLRSEIEMMMSDRDALLRVAGAAAKFVEGEHRKIAGIGDPAGRVAGIQRQRAVGGFAEGCAAKRETPLIACTVWARRE